jgi:hypothetical protein
MSIRDSVGKKLTGGVRRTWVSMKGDHFEGLHSDFFEGLVSPQKLEKASCLLHLPEFDHGNTKDPLKLIQELRGNQQFRVLLLPSLKPLFAATNALLGPKAQN